MLVMLDVFADSVFQWLPSEEDHSRETLRLEIPKPSLHVGVQVGTLRWQQDDIGVGVLLDEFPHGEEAAISVDDQMAGILQESVFIVSQVAAGLLHPRSIRQRCAHGVSSGA